MRAVKQSPKQKSLRVLLQQVDSAIAEAGSPQASTVPKAASPAASAKATPPTASFSRHALMAPPAPDGASVDGSASWLASAGMLTFLKEVGLCLQLAPF